MTAPSEEVSPELRAWRLQKWGPEPPPRYGVSGPRWWNPRRPAYGRSQIRNPNYCPALASYTLRPPHGRWQGNYLDARKRRAVERWYEDIANFRDRIQVEEEQGGTDELGR